jgi:hypothetical protein
MFVESLKRTIRNKEMEARMKKVTVSFVMAALLVMAVVGSAFAEGAPQKHGVDGKTFGAAVSGLAQSGPGAVADHVSGGKSGGNDSSNAGGAPAVHGIDGKTFGAAVSGLAQSAPGAVAAHVSGK